MPFRICVTSIAFFTLTRLFGGISYAPIQVRTAVFFVTCFVAFSCGYCGTRVMENRRRKPVARDNRVPESDILAKVARTLLWIGCFGILVGLVDLGDKVGSIAEAGLTGARVLNQIEGGRFSYLSIVSQLTSYSAFAAICLQLVHRRRIALKEAQFYLVLVIGLALIQLSSGGRNGIVFILVNIVAIGIVRRGVGMRTAPELPSLIRWQLAVVMAATLLYCSFIVVDRHRINDRTRHEALSNIDNYFDARVNDDRFRGPTGTILYSFVFYMSHPLSSLDYILNDSWDTGPYYGAVSFAKLAIGLRKCGFSVYTVHDVGGEIAVSGCYYTLLGSFLLDWGVPGTVFASFVLGALASFFWRRTLVGRHPQDMIVSAYIVFLLIFSPVYFAMNISNGFDILCGIVTSGSLFVVFRIRSRQTVSRAFHMQPWSNLQELRRGR